MDKEQAMLLEEVAAFQSRLEQRPMSTVDAMQLSTKQIIEDIFPVRLAPLPLPLSIPPCQHFFCACVSGDSKRVGYVNKVSF